MHIRRVALHRYKRFTELTVELPDPCRLVMLCGPNGTGKSSLLEALKFWQDFASQQGVKRDAEYFLKGGREDGIDWQNRVEVVFHEGPVETADASKAMYFRTAYRNEPEFESKTISRMGDIVAGPRPGRMIDNDTRVSDNYQRLAGQAFNALFAEVDDGLRAVELRDRLVGRLGNAVAVVLPELRLEGLADPLGGGTFRFAKGITQDFPYKNLSGGEKAVFDLLLDMAVKAPAMPGAVIWIDEPEVHTNPLVQTRLLDLVAPDTLVLCEGQPSKGERAEFDARCLRAVFGDYEPDVDFVAIGGDRQVIADQMGLGRTVQALVPGTTVIRLIDRDDRTDSEVEKLRQEGVTTLGRRNLEGYLLDEEVLEALCTSLDESDKWVEVQVARKDAHQSAITGGKPVDDWKATKGDIYNACRRILRLLVIQQRFCRAQPNLDNVEHLATLYL